MKKIILFIAFFFSLFCFSQNEQLAIYYYEKGDFEKAKMSFEELLKAAPYNANYFQKTIECYQQLKQFELAGKLLETRFKTYKQNFLLVDLGYNFHLQKNEVLAKKYYDLALDCIKKSSNEVYAIENSFERKGVLDYALKSYQTALSIEPNFKFNYQMAQLYGQMGDIDRMIATYLDEAFMNPQNSIPIQNQLARFMVEDGDKSFNETLRKALVAKAQKNQDVFWNSYLSWFYVQQKEFGKAFIQEKAVYKRNPNSLASIMNLGQLTVDEADFETAKEIFGFVIESTKDLDLLVKAHSFLAQMRIDTAEDKDLPLIETELSALLTQYGTTPATLSLQIIQAHFVAFKLKKPAEAKILVKKTLNLSLNPYDESKVKMELADILLFEEKFNQALIYYTQIEENLKNDVLAHEASLKAAKTSYFQGDFDWALKQFKELKSASTQLIANDALEYFLLINDNKVADSTQTTLKRFAKGDFLLYQKRNKEAETLFQDILKSLKEKNANADEIEAIEPLTFVRLGQIYEKQGNYALALSQYESVISQHSESIYIDEALFFSASIYSNKLKEPEKAKPLYEKIIFNHQDSIYFVEARKEYRQLRGDKNL